MCVCVCTCFYGHQTSSNNLLWVQPKSLFRPKIRFTSEKYQKTSMFNLNWSTIYHWQRHLSVYHSVWSDIACTKFFIIFRWAFQLFNSFYWIQVHNILRMIWARQKVRDIHLLRCRIILLYCCSVYSILIIFPLYGSAIVWE